MYVLLLLACCLVIVTTKQLIGEVKCNQGETIILPCDVTHDSQMFSPYVIEWLRHGENIPIMMKIWKGRAQVSSAYGGRISIKNSTIPDASLLMRNVTTDDAGIYVCRVLFLNEKFPMKEDDVTVRLVVEAPPTLVVTPPPTEQGKEGSSLLLRCLASGVPQPVITWTKDDWSIRDGQNGIKLNEGELHIPKLRRSHSGRYTCRAQSVQGQVQHTTVVYVSAPPVFTKLPQDFTPKEAGTALFSCEAKGYPSAISYKWYHNGTPVTSSENLRGRYNVLDDHTLYIYDVILTDKGTVTCEATNGYGSPITSSASLRVEFRARVTHMPSIVYAGISLPVKLFCPTLAEPQVNRIIWEKDNFVIRIQQNSRMSTDGNGSLIIHSVIQSDAGRYTCTPYNIVGTVGKSPPTHVVIRDPPRFTIRPKGIYEQSVGSQLLIPCAGIADPTPSISWRKVSSKVPATYCVDGGNLSILSLRKSHHGVWQCVLSNQVGDVTTNVMIIVTYTTPHGVSNLTTWVVSDTSVSVKWNAGYSGGYTQVFTLWYKRLDQGNHTWRTIFSNTRNEAVLQNLIPGTTYEVAVIPSNQAGKGPFSVTKTVKTSVATVRSSPTPAFIARPSNLASRTTPDGKVIIEWEYNDVSSVIGYVIEYRRIGEDLSILITTPLPIPVANGVSEVRRKRSLVAEWKRLDIAPNNVSSYVIEPNKLYRNQIYEIQIMAVTSFQYSEPSVPFNISTKGLTTYPLYVDKEFVKTGDGSIIGGVFGCILAILILVGVITWLYRRRKLQRENKTNGSPSRSNVSSSDENQISYDDKQDKERKFHLTRTDGFTSAASDQTYKTNVLKNRSVFSSENNIDLEDCLLHQSFSQDVGGLNHNQRSKDNDSIRTRRETAVKVLFAQQENMRKVLGVKYNKNATLPSRPFSGVPDYLKETLSTSCVPDLNGTTSSRTFVRRISFEDRRHEESPQIKDDLVFGVVGFDSPHGVTSPHPNLCQDNDNVISRDHQQQIDDVVIAGYGSRFCDISDITSHQTPLLSSSPIKNRPNDQNPLREQSFNKEQFLLQHRRPRTRASYSCDYERARPHRWNQNHSLDDRSVALEIDCSNSDIEVRYIKSLTKQVVKELLRNPLKVGSNKMGMKSEESSFSRQKRPSIERSDISPKHRTSLEALLSPTHEIRRRERGFPQLKLKEADEINTSSHPRNTRSKFSGTAPQLLDQSLQPSIEISTSFIPKPTVISLADIPDSLRVENNDKSVSSPTSSSSCSPRKFKAHPQNFELSKTCSPDQINKPYNLMQDLQTDTSTCQWGSLGRLSKLKTLSLPINSYLPPETAVSGIDACLQTDLRGGTTSSNNCPTISNSSFNGDSTITTGDVRSVNALKDEQAKCKFFGGGADECTNTAHPRHNHGESSSSGYVTQDTLLSSPGTKGARNSDRSRRDNSSVEDNYEWDSEYAMESEILEALKNFESLKSSTSVSEELRRQLCKFTVNAESDDSSMGVDATYEAIKNDSEMREEDLKKEDIERRCAILKREFLHFRRLQQDEF
nr:uncharacterized protein LOC100184924 isoform X1 [Ciona intestinalis]|eukprot:XP_018666826.1 uncharacterized protein LOC100184924 isoform X1 [Ciona intestinalis]